MSLRKFVGRLALICSLAFASGLTCHWPRATCPLLKAADFAEEYRVYVGTYTGPKSQGIYSFRFNPASGATTVPELAVETRNPSWVTVDAAHRFLYAVNEVGDYQGQKSGGVSAFAINRQTGKLDLLNEVASRGADPCYVSLDGTGEFVLVANYTSGNIAVFPVQADGRLGEATAFVQHRGSSANRERQEGPHAHMISVSRDNRFALVADLGLDELLVYRFDPVRGFLTPNNPPLAKVRAGLGPRHFAFSPDEKFLYLISEMGSAITAFTFNHASGALHEIATVSTLPADFKGHNDCAEIAVHPSGRFLYGSNRGHNTIAVFSIDPPSGKLTPVEHVSTGGKTPRSFAIDPTGSYLFAANQDSDSIVIFKIDRVTGRLSPTGQKIAVGSPVCVTFVSE